MIPINKYENNYFITVQGEVYNQKSLKQLAVNVNKQTGYKEVSLWKDNKGKNLTIHRLIAEQFISNPLGLPQVNHKDGNKLNNAISNLEWVSAKDNIRHAISTGLATQIKRKFTLNEYLEMLDMYLEGNSLTYIAKLYDTGITRISYHIKEAAKLYNKLDIYLKEQSRQKQERATKSSKHRTRAIVQKTLNDDYVATFNSVKDAARALNKQSSGSISNVLVGRTKSAYGFKWEYVNSSSTTIENTSQDGSE